MNRFMFAAENFMRTVGVGYRAVINRSQEKIKNAAIFDHSMESGSTYYSGKRTSRQDHRLQNELYDKSGYRRR